MRVGVSKVCVKLELARAPVNEQVSQVRRVSLSQAVVVDRMVYVSGQLGLDVASGQLVDGGVQAQANQVRLTRTNDDDDDGGDNYDHYVSKVRAPR